MDWIHFVTLPHLGYLSAQGSEDKGINRTRLSPNQTSQKCD